MKNILILIIITVFPAAASSEGFHGYGKDCYCTDANRNRVEVGEQRCLTISGTSFVAECQMSQNVPIWRRVGDVCPVGSQIVQPGLYARLVDAQIGLTVNQMTVQN